MLPSKDEYLSAYNKNASKWEVILRYKKRAINQIN